MKILSLYEYCSEEKDDSFNELSCDDGDCDTEGDHGCDCYSGNG